MTKQTKSKIPLNRLTIYLLLGAGIIAFALVGKESTQSNTAELKSAETAEPELGIVKRSDQSAGSASALIEIDDIESLTEDLDALEEAVESEFDVDIASLEKQSFFSERRRVRADRRRSGEFDIGIEDSDVSDSGEKESNGKDLDADSANGNANDAVDQLLVADGSTSGSLNTNSGVADNAGTDDSVSANDTDNTATDEADNGTDATDEESDDPDTDTIRLAGRWSGTMESSATVNLNGDPCVGAAVSVNLFYYNLTGQYEISGTARPNAGFLNRAGSSYYKLDGQVTTNGQLNANNEPLHPSWEAPTYRADYAGIIGDIQGNGTWTDSFGCSGTWFLAKR